ncbi:SUGAR KINASE [Salix koriyanagi]|uniref:SUGAR KINASE n=1 Tax=Salix koriyanagi TaxID=2511006 RepID=A0A9Q0TDJ0_9ROSI|nr:SUGAR KINASE [Salix koriyanagi]
MGLQPRKVLDNSTSDILEGMNGQQVEEFDPPEVRALIEGQFLSMRAHSERFGMPSPPRRIIAAGGASADQSISDPVLSLQPLRPLELH